ncbi:MAG TPA: class I SAM-dependent methyltransferase [Ignavibacteria bacterium]|nr:class I SAM-dependent methyltransferase [Ignavibacteria bacterium]
MTDQIKEIRFDDYVDTYKSKIQHSIDFIGQDVDFFIEIKAHMLLELAEKYLGKLDKINVIDIGSGVGLVDKYIAPYFKSLTGIDVEGGVIDKASENNSGITYLLYDGKRLPFDDNTFDLAFAINVIHHVPVEKWQNFVNEMQRVIKPGGLAVIFEHNPANPLTRKVVSGCEFDFDAVLLPHKKIKALFNNSGLKIKEDAYIIFFPLKNGLFRIIERFLKWVPLGAQQYVAAEK